MFCFIYSFVVQINEWRVQSKVNSVESKTTDSNHAKTPLDTLSKQTQKESDSPTNQKIPSQPSVQQQKIAYLTFDDGPSKLTNQILDVLKRENIQATFFMVGTNITRYPNEVKRAVSEGNYVGAHSMTHDYHKLYKQNQFVVEMQQTISLIKQLTGEDTNLIRAPFGTKPGLHEQLRTESANARFKVWDWTVDAVDWKNDSTPFTVINEVNRQATKNCEVILLHEKQITLDSLPQIISNLRAKGYVFKSYSSKNHFPLNFWDDRRL